MMNNRNPFHDYRDLAIIDLEISKISKDAYNKNLLLPDMRRGGFKEWDFWNYSKHFGFNTCASKEDLAHGLSIPSQIWRGEIRPYTFKEKARLKKDGTPYIRKKGNPVFVPNSCLWIYDNEIAVMEFISNDIQSFWEYCNMNRQVSTGLIHKDRRVVVGDFDRPIEEDTIAKLEDICERYCIPHFTYIEIHLDTNHFQIGWILDEPIDYKGHGAVVYREMTKYVSYIFDSDRQFKGWIIKNPNCVYMTKTYWYNDTVSCLELANSLRNAYKENFNTPIFVRNVDETISKIEIPINGNVKINSYVDERSSRNCCLLKELREWLVSYDKENGELPEQKAINQKAYEISAVLGKLTQKGILPKSEIDKVVKSVVKFVRENKNERCYSQKQRFGNLVRGSERELNILDVYALMKQGYKRKVIQDKLGLKIDALNKYIRFVKDNPYLIENGRVEDVIPKTMELSKINKSIKYGILITNVKKKLEEIQKGKFVMAG